MTRLLAALFAALFATIVYRAWLEVRGRLIVIEATCDEAVGRLTVLTAEHAGGYESDAFARVSTGGREQLETATTGLEGAKWN